MSAARVRAGRQDELRRQHPAVSAAIAALWDSLLRDDVDEADLALMLASYKLVSTSGLAEALADDRSRRSELALVPPRG